MLERRLPVTIKSLVQDTSQRPKQRWVDLSSLRIPKKRKLKPSELIIESSNLVVPLNILLYPILLVVAFKFTIQKSINLNTGLAGFKVDFFLHG